MIRGERKSIGLSDRVAVSVPSNQASPVGKERWEEMIRGERKSIGLSVRVAVSVSSNQAGPLGCLEPRHTARQIPGEDRSKECNKNSRVRPQSNGGSLDSACMAEHMPVLGSQLAHTITREERERDFKHATADQGQLE